MLPLEVPFKHFRVLFGMGWRERTMAKVFGAEAKAPAVAYFVREPVHNRGESYLLYGPDYAKRVIYIRGKSAEEVRREMELVGVQELYSARNNAAEEPLLRAAVDQGILEKGEGRLYHLR
jgi:hypothetical protein